MGRFAPSIEAQTQGRAPSRRTPPPEVIRKILRPAPTKLPKEPQRPSMAGAPPPAGDRIDFTTADPPRWVVAHVEADGSFLGCEDVRAGQITNSLAATVMIVPDTLWPQPRSMPVAVPVIPGPEGDDGARSQRLRAATFAPRLAKSAKPVPSIWRVRHEIRLVKTVKLRLSAANSYRNFVLDSQRLLNTATKSSVKPGYPTTGSATIDRFRHGRRSTTPSSAKRSARPDLLDWPVASMLVIPCCR